MIAYLQALMKDLLFMRVCMFLWGTPFAILAGWGLVSWLPREPLEWLLDLFLVGVGAFGAFLVGVSVIGTPQRVEKTIDFMHDGGDLPGLIFTAAVLVLAVPITAIVRAMRTNTPS